MKKYDLKEKVSLLFYLSLLIINQLPVFIVNEKRFLSYQAYFYVKANGAKALSNAKISMWTNGTLDLLKVQMIVLVISEIMSLIYLLLILMKKKSHFNIVAMALMFFNIILNNEGFWVISDNLLGQTLFIIVAILSVLELLITKMIDSIISDGYVKQ